MNDYRRIRVNPGFRRLKGKDTAGFHARSIQWLRDQLDSDEGKPTIVVTHHAPSSRSLDPAESEELISAAYASNLDTFVGASHAKLWIHGHIHRPVSYRTGETLVVSNPRGYPSGPIVPTFNPALVLEV